MSVKTSERRHPAGRDSSGENSHRRRLRQRGLEIHLALSAVLLASGERTVEGDEVVDTIIRRLAPDIEGLRTLASKRHAGTVYVTAPGVVFDRDFLQMRLAELQQEAGRQSRAVHVIEPRDVFSRFSRSFPRHAAGRRRQRFLLGFHHARRCPKYLHVRAAS